MPTSPAAGLSTLVFGTTASWLASTSSRSWSAVGDCGDSMASHAVYEFEWVSSISVRDLGVPFWCATEIQGDVCLRAGDIIIMIMPGKDSDAVAIARGEG